MCGCDQGTQRVEPVGQAIAPVTLVSANVGPNQALPANGRIELGFDRLLQPTSITRQTFVLANAGESIPPYTPTVAYDPVARIVTITPLTDKTQVLVPGQSYEVIVLGPQSAADVNGLRAIDGATPRQRVTRIAFSVTDASPEPPQTVSIDFCRDIFTPIISNKCTLPQCHGESTPAAGLQLYPQTGIPTTAIGRVAQGSNTGPLSAASAPTLLFGEDMPIIDPTGGGNPANSWLMYKVLLATPEPEPVDASTGETDGAGAGADASADVGADADGDAGARDASADAGAGDASADTGAGDASAEAGTTSPLGPPMVPPIDVSGVYAVGWQGISTAERATLSNYILGREMPFPPQTGVGLGVQNDPLTLDEMERLSLWIAQGAKVPAASCPH